ncbi:MAG: galactokinase, partial [Clostridia bacterium]|nr:galactokinase [Clostridia bacterium]
MNTRIENLKEKFRTLFPESEPVIFSAPGRTELGGNHTDHQHGRVLCAAVELNILACAAPNGTDKIRIHSEGYAPFEVSITDTAPAAGEANTSAALVRGIAARISELGYTVGGFDAYVVSEVLPGSGLSSSAAFEVLTGTIINHFFCADKLRPEEIAQIGQYAENVYFGKPCGLMDQMA